MSMNQLATHVFTHGLHIDPPTEANPQPHAGYMSALRNDPEQAMRNVAQVLMRHTEVTRYHNGRGRCSTYVADADAIAQTGRQLAELVLAYFGDMQAQEHDDDNEDECPF